MSILRPVYLGKDGNFSQFWLYRPSQARRVNNLILCRQYIKILGKPKGDNVRDDYVIVNF